MCGISGESHVNRLAVGGRGRELGMRPEECQDPRRSAKGTDGRYRRSWPPICSAPSVDLSSTRAGENTASLLVQRTTSTNPTQPRMSGSVRLESNLGRITFAPSSVQFTHQTLCKCHDLTHDVTGLSPHKHMRSKRNPQKLTFCYLRLTICRIRAFMAREKLY